MLPWAKLKVFWLALRDVPCEDWVGWSAIWMQALGVSGVPVHLGDVVHGSPVGSELEDGNAGVCILSRVGYTHLDLALVEARGVCGKEVVDLVPIVVVEPCRYRRYKHHFAPRSVEEMWEARRVVQESGPYESRSPSVLWVVVGEHLVGDVPLNVVGHYCGESGLWWPHRRGTVWSQCVGPLPLLYVWALAFVPSGWCGLLLPLRWLVRWWLCCINWWMLVCRLLSVFCSTCGHYHLFVGELQGVPVWLLGS